MTDLQVHVRPDPSPELMAEALAVLERLFDQPASGDTMRITLTLPRELAEFMAWLRHKQQVRNAGSVGVDLAAMTPPDEQDGHPRAEQTRVRRYLRSTVLEHLKAERSRLMAGQHPALFPVRPSVRDMDDNLPF